MSRRPRRSRDATATRLTSSRRLKSPGTTSTRRPVARSISAAASFSAASSREQMATRAPSAARVRATARPMPLLPPVTSAVLPSSPRSMTWLLSPGSPRRPARHRAPVEATRGVRLELRHLALAASHRAREVVQVAAAEALTEELGRALVQQSARPISIAVGQMLEAHRDLDEPLQALARGAVGAHPRRLEQLVHLEV